MTDKSWEKLYRKYPTLFINIGKSPSESCMAFGIECDGGWFDIISSVCYRIYQHEQHNKDGYVKVVFDQIKEKYGGLRIYYHGGDDYIDGVIDMAEEMSYKLCEVCGSPGGPNKEGWIRVLCEKCRDNTNNS